MQSSSGSASPRVAMVTTALAVLLALTGVIAIAAGAGDKDDDNKVALTGTTTTSTTETSLASGTTGVTTPGATTTTAKAGTTGTTAKGGTTQTTNPALCPNPPAAAADPGGHQPPAIGTYTYASCSDSSDTTDSKIAAGTNSNGVTRRTVSNSESGADQTATLSWGPSGVLLESLRVKSDFGDFTCDWKPDVVNYPPTLTVGTQWNAKSSCDLKPSSGGASPGKLDLDASGKVTGKVAYTVAGTTVNAWVVEGTIKLTTTVAFGGNNNSTTATINQKSYYDPAHGLDVWRHSESNQGGENIVRDERLVSLAPKSS